MTVLFTLNMAALHEYLKMVLKQILESYDVLKKLQDKSGDLLILKRELAKINGLLQVIVTKIEDSGNTSDDIAILLKISRHYLHDYDFTREIETMSPLYSEDPHRLKNLRHIILTSLNNRKLIEKIENVKNDLDELP